MHRKGKRKKISWEQKNVIDSTAVSTTIMREMEEEEHGFSKLYLKPMYLQKSDKK